MNLEVAVFIGNCTDVHVIDKMIKAAYLYADIVRVYDFSLPNGYRKGEFFYNKYTEIEKKVEKKNEQLIIRYPFLGDEDQNSYNGLLELSPEERMALLNRLDRLVKMRGFLFERHIFYNQFEKFQDQRKENNEQYDHMKFQNEMAQIGITYIEPTVEKNNPFHATEAYDNLCSRYFDDKAFKIVSDLTYLEKKGLEPSLVWPPGYLAEYSISLLPGFEDATIDEIVDIRTELDKYIIPFRAAMLRMAQNIKGIPNTDSFQRDCMTLYFRDIEPKVAAINAAIDDNNVLKNIAKKIITNKETWVSVGALATAFATTGDIANAVSIGTATALGGLSIAQGVVSTLEEKKKIKDNEMFFLYEARKRLKKN